MNKKTKLAYIIPILDKCYTIAKRHKGNPLSTLILTILSQNTNDKNRDRAYNSLRRRFPSWEKVLSARTSEIEEAIRVGGLAKQKSKSIRAALQWIKQYRGKLTLDFLCKMPENEALALLTSLRGVGLKTAHVVLLFGCGKDLFPVDTHILRVSKRLGLLPAKCSADKAHILWKEIIPKGKAYSLHLRLIEHGRKICHARGSECPICPLRSYCDYRAGEGSN